MFGSIQNGTILLQMKHMLRRLHKVDNGSQLYKKDVIVLSLLNIDFIFMKITYLLNNLKAFVLLFKIDSGVTEPKNL